MKDIARMEDKHPTPYSIYELQNIQKREKEKRNYKVISIYVREIYDAIIYNVKNTDNTNFSCVLEEKEGIIRYRFPEEKYPFEIKAKENNMKGNISKILAELEILFPQVHRTTAMKHERDEKTGESHLIVELNFDWS